MNKKCLLSIKGYYPYQQPYYPPPPPPRKRFPIILVIIILAVIGVGAFAAYWFFFGPGSAGGKSFEELINARDEYKVKFNYVWKGQQGEYNGIFILARKGDSCKVQFSQAGTEILSVKKPDGGFVCVKTVGRKWFCMKGESKKKQKILSPEEIKEEMGEVEPAGQRVIAGETCSCWKGTYTKGNMKEENLVCLTNDGIITYVESKVYMGSTQTAYMIFEAEKIWRSVSDDEFKPPVKLVGGTP